MGPFSAYSPIHFLIWYILARSTNMSWKLFFILSIAWEVFEWIFSLFFNSSFFVENTINRTTDIIINIAGFYLGKK
ncbi:hypothetical protein HOH11_00075 [Candidatus Woesearchaeota archaeon]|jgi:hypothetical protein|nr:hypothetical protein [Candidatus Woesearchaeota archaeon]MBT6022989.1 hypothetical protein [Candidatus Woesearchaeota archaeon]